MLEEVGDVATGLGDGLGDRLVGHLLNLSVELIDAVPPEDVLSINTPEQLAEVDAILTARLEAVQP